MKKKKVSTKELVGYIISGVIALFGVALMITHTVGVYLPVLNSNNAVVIAENAVINALKINLDFLGWGIMCMSYSIYQHSSFQSLLFSRKIILS